MYLDCDLNIPDDDELHAPYVGDADGDAPFEEPEDLLYFDGGDD